MFDWLLPGWLRGPLCVRLGLGDRPFRLGEGVDITVEVDSRKDIEVVVGRIELVCNERYGETYLRRVPVTPARGVISQRRGPATTSYPKREVKEFHKSFVHSSVVFLRNGHLSAGMTSTYPARLRIQPEKPPHLGTGIVRWFLTATLEVPGKRDVTWSREISVEAS